MLANAEAQGDPGNAQTDQHADGSVCVSDQTANSMFDYAGIMMKALTRPYEVMHVVAGPRIITFTTKQSKQVGITSKFVLQNLKLMHVPIESVTAIVHNHPENQTNTSGSDDEAKKEFEQAGFRGNYQIYARKKFINVDEDQKK